MTTSDDEHVRPARRETETNRRVTRTNEEVVEREAPRREGAGSRDWRRRGRR